MERQWNYSIETNLFIKYFCEFFDTPGTPVGVQLSHGWNQLRNSQCGFITQPIFSESSNLRCYIRHTGWLLHKMGSDNWFPVKTQLKKWWSLNLSSIWKNNNSRVSNIDSDNSQHVGLEDYNNISVGIFPNFTTPSIKTSLGLKEFEDSFKF